MEGRKEGRKDGGKEGRKEERKKGRKEERKKGRKEERKKGRKEERKKGRKEERKKGRKEERKEGRKERRKEGRNVTLMVLTNLMAFLNYDIGGKMRLIFAIKHLVFIYIYNACFFNIKFLFFFCIIIIIN